MVSIIIPVFNGTRFVKNCIRSVLAQSYADVEAIVVDDGSTDGLERMAGELQAKYIRIDNSGVTAARRRGIEEASGEWICFLDVDDTLPPDAIEKYSKLFDSGADIIASGEPSLTLEEYKCGLMRRKSHPELWGKLFRAEFIRKHWPAVDRSITVGEDQMINLVLANNANKLATVPEMLYRYNLGNPDSVMKRFRRTAEYEIRFQRLFDTMVRPGFGHRSSALRYAEYKMKIEGFKMVVLDGKRFDPSCPEWQAVVSYYRAHPSELAPSERLMIALEKWQGVYGLIMKIVLVGKR